MLHFAMVVALVALLTPAASAQQGDSGTVQGEEGQYVVFFGLDSAAIDAAARQVIRSAAEDYERTGAAYVEVHGYADTSGNVEYNEALSERRADAVTEALIAQGVPAAAITQVGLGEAEFVETGDGVREPRNRRVEIEVERPPAPAVVEPAPPARVVEPAPVVVTPAEPAREPERGLFSLGALYGFNLLDESSEDEDESHLAGLNLSFDYAIIDWVSLSLEQAGFYHFADDEGFGGRSAAGLNFTLGLTDVVPYIGGNIGYIYGSGFDDDFFAGPEVGLNLGPLNAKVAYDIPFGRDLDEGIVMTTVALGIRF
jgi:OmpA family